MSEVALERLDIGTLGVAAIRGWAAGVLFGAALYGPIEAAGAAPPGEAFHWILFGVFLLSVQGAIIGGFHAIPAALFAVPLLWLAERAPSRLRSLPVWLAIGFVASVPTAYLLWHNSIDFNVYEQPNPYHWYHVKLVFIALASGLVGGYVAWRAEGRIIE